MTFKIYTRRSNTAEWSLYGEFSTETEFQREIPNIRWLGLQVWRVRVGG